MNFFENLYKIKKFAERQAFQNKRFLSMIKRPKLEIDNRVLFRDKKAWLKSPRVRLLGCVVLGAAAVISILSFSV